MKDEEHEFMDILKERLAKLFTFNICQVVALGTLIVNALDLMSKKYRSQALLTSHQETETAELISEYKLSMLRFVRVNYEIFVDHFKT